MTAQLKTRAQLAREVKHKRVIALFYELRREYPNFSNWRYLCAIAEKEGMTQQGVRKILIKHNVIKARKRNTQIEI